MPRSIPIPPLALALVANLGVAGCSASSHDPPGADASSGSSSSVNLPPEDASLADASIPVAECLDAGTVIYTTRLSAPPVIARDSLSSYVWGSGQTIEVWTQDEATQIYFAGPKGGAPLSVGMYNDAVPEHEQTAGEPQPGLDFSADDLALCPGNSLFSSRFQIDVLNLDQGSEAGTTLRAFTAGFEQTCFLGFDASVTLRGCVHYGTGD